MTKDIVRPHKVLENRDTKVPALSLTEGPHSTIVFSYGKVEFNQDDPETLKLEFEYEVHDDNGVDYDVLEFEKELGDFLVELIMYGLQDNSIVYSGGSDSTT